MKASELARGRPGGRWDGEQGWEDRVNGAQSPDGELACRAAFVMYLISVLLGSQTFALYHFYSCFSAIWPAQQQRQRCSSPSFAWLFSMQYCKQTPEVPGCSAKPWGFCTSSPRPTSQQSHLPLQVQPHLLRGI